MSSVGSVDTELNNRPWELTAQAAFRSAEQDVRRLVKVDQWYFFRDGNQQVFDKAQRAANEAFAGTNPNPNPNPMHQDFELWIHDDTPNDKYNKEA